MTLGARLGRIFFAVVATLVIVALIFTLAQP
jgi:hypothetical protein